MEQACDLSSSRKLNFTFLFTAKLRPLNSEVVGFFLLFSRLTFEILLTLTF